MDSMTQHHALASARLYLCTDARKRQGDFEDFVDAAFQGGVDIIQLRDKTIEAAEELELLAVLRSVAERHGRLWAVNDRADVASVSGAPVFHVGQKDLPLEIARTFLPRPASIGLSTHTPEQVNAAITASPGRTNHNTTPVAQPSTAAKAGPRPNTALRTIRAAALKAAKASPHGTGTGPRSHTARETQAAQNAVSTPTRKATTPATNGGGRQRRLALLVASPSTVIVIDR